MKLSWWSQVGLIHSSYVVRKMQRLKVGLDHLACLFWLQGTLLNKLQFSSGYSKITVGMLSWCAVIWVGGCPKCSSFQFLSLLKYLLPVICLNATIRRCSLRKEVDKTSFGAFVDINPLQEKISLRTLVYISLAMSSYYNSTLSLLTDSQ